jgi:hypothetical protein
MDLFELLAGGTFLSAGFWGTFQTWIAAAVGMQSTRFTRLFERFPL